MNLKYTFLLVMIFIIGCSDRDVLIVDNSIKLSCYSVHILAGDEALVDLLSKSDNLGLIDGNPEIASGWWTNNGKSILIKGESVGLTSIYIKNRYRPDKIAEIKVFSDCFAGNYKEDGNNATLIVQAFDKSIQEVIESELETLAKSRSGILYSFDKDSKSVVIKKCNGSSNVGKYEWNKDCLNLHVNGTIDNYKFRSIDNNTVCIELDLSDVYKQKFPTTPIYRVRLALSLTRYQPPLN